MKKQNGRCWIFFCCSRRDIKITPYLVAVMEFPWGQRGVRFYDPDMHIVEVSKSMASVVKRFRAEGLSIEQTAERIQCPIEFVKSFL
jgi:hypothetical protein